MKKSIFCLAIFMIALVKLNAQENVVKVNPLGLAFGVSQLSYERALDSNSAAELSLAYTSLNASFGSTEAKVSGFGGEIKYKFYFSSSNDAPRGWYAAPLVNYSSASGSSGSSKGEVSAFGGGLVAGYQWVFGGSDSGFALDINLGAQYASTKTSGGITNIKFDGVLPRLGVSLGYAW